MWSRLIPCPYLRASHVRWHIWPTNQARYLSTPSDYRVVEHTIDCSHSREYLAETANGNEDIPKLAVKQYVPHDNPNPQPGDVTIIGAHANGFPKVAKLYDLSIKILLTCQELYEPLWDELHDRARQQDVRIRSIWIADVWNQGQSGIINERVLGNDRE